MTPCSCTPALTTTATCPTCPYTAHYANEEDAQAFAVRHKGLQGHQVRITQEDE